MYGNVHNAAMPTPATPAGGCPPRMQYPGVGAQPIFNPVSKVGYQFYFLYIETCNFIFPNVSRSSILKIHSQVYNYLAGAINHAHFWRNFSRENDFYQWSPKSQCTEVRH